MAAGMPSPQTLPSLAGRSRPRATFGGARSPPAGRRRVVAVRGEAGQWAPRQGLLRLGSALLSATLVLSAGTATLQPPPASAESALERRQAEMQRRKELLAAAREKALAGGGQEEGADPADAAASVSAAEEQKVNAANEEVERGNTGRGQEAARMLDSLKSSVQGYEAATSESKAKPAEASQGPSWLQGLLNKADKPQAEAPSSRTSEAPPASEPKAVEPAPTPSPPAFSFAKPKAEEPPSPPPAPTAPAPPPAPPAAKPAESSGPSFEFPSFQSLQSLTEPAAKPEPKPERAHAPAPTPAAPKPAPPAEQPPAKKIGPQPVQPVRKEQKAAAAAKSGKRKGSLPAALVQLLLLASFGGLGYLVFFKEREVDRALAVAVGAVAAAYKTVAGVFGRGGKSA